MSGAERGALILAEAVTFFAEFGFSGDTRELARRAHVTHPLLYKYFATKEALIERVYEAVYLGRWNTEWEQLLSDRTAPLRERMKRFYLAFAEVILHRDWVRLFMFFGLRGADINERWFLVIKERLVLPLCAELRHEFGLPSLDAVPPTVAELELVQGISSRIFAYGIREHIYGMPLPGPVAPLVESEIDAFIDGIGATLGKLVVVKTAKRGKPSKATTAAARNKGATRS